jgi:hypothetical protein
MTLIIQKPTGAKLNMRQTYIGTDDPDAAAYIAAVETADGQALETATRVAIHSFVKGCKADGIWPAIKASCILAGARTRLGALTPLVGTAPTSFNFVDGDYNRKTGLVGDGSTKYLDSNRAHNADPQNNHHLSIYIDTIATATMSYVGAGQFGVSLDQTSIFRNTSGTPRLDVRSRSASANGGSPTATGFAGVSRALSSSFTARVAGSTASISLTSVSGAGTENYLVFARNTTPVGLYSDARLAFYSVGESLDLALLDARVTDLINAFGAAIP